LINGVGAILEHTGCGFAISTSLKIVVFEQTSCVIILLSRVGQYRIRVHLFTNQVYPVILHLICINGLAVLFTRDCG